MNILQINSSARAYANGNGSYSTRFASELVQGLRAKHPGSELTVRDLAVVPHPMLDEATLEALHTPAEHRTSLQASRVALDDALIAELLAADVIVLGVPMYNFSVPVQLKNWIDAICRIGKTFRYTEQGPVGLVEGKTVHVVVCSGGVHRGQPTDVITPYLRTVLGFLGMRDVHFVYGEGLAMGPEAEGRAFAEVRSQMAQSI